MADLNAANLEMGPANVYLHLLPQAFLETNMAGTNNDLRFVAKQGGMAGNTIRVQLIDPGANDVPLSVNVVGKDILVTLATGPAGAITSTAAQVRDAINTDARARALVLAMLKTGNDGSGVVTVLALTALANGSDMGVRTNIGFLGENMQVAVSTAAQPLTGAQTGDIPQDKVVTGGRCQFRIPFKEITLANIQRGFPNALLFDDANGLQRVDFVSQVGQSMRALAVKMEIVKITGGAESPLSKDKLIIPLASPVDGEVTIPYQPTTQRVIEATFEAWPDANGRWMFFGDQDF